jgi:predicted PurR-regulated permease PerM
VLTTNKSVSTQSVSTPQPTTIPNLQSTSTPTPSSGIPIQSSLSQRTSIPGNKSTKPSTSKSKPKSTSKPTSNILIRRAQQIILLFRTISTNLSTSLTKSPTALLRTLVFIVGLLILLGRKELRERVRRIVEAGWQKVKGTVGMGVKVSYI